MIIQNGYIQSFISDKIQDDTVYSELQKEARHYKAGDEDVNLTLAMYMLGFSSYLGFNEVK